jgi:hypothetical protein
MTAGEKTGDIRIKDMPVRFVPIDLGDGLNVGQLIKNSGVTVLYITPLRAFDVKQITAVTRLARIASITDVPAYVAEGVSVGLDIKGEKPQIIINLPASRQEGMDLSSQVLKLAMLVE